MCFNLFLRQFCKEKGIPYIHFPNLKQNIQSAMSHYISMSLESIKGLDIPGKIPPKKQVCGCC